VDGTVRLALRNEIQEIFIRSGALEADMALDGMEFFKKLGVRVFKKRPVAVWISKVLVENRVVARADHARRFVLEMQGKAP